MTTIGTIEDLLRLLRENEEFRAAVRRELLTEELLALPQRFAEYTKVTNSRLGGVETRLDSMDTRLENVETRLDGVETRLENVETRLGGVETRLGGVETKVDALRGDALEAKTPTHLCQMLSDALDIRRVQVVWMPHGIVAPLSRMDEFASRMEEAAEAGTITDADEGRLSRTDMVARSLRRADGTRLWIAAEASGVIGENDISRARQSAKALGKLYSQDAVPAVYGYRIADEQRKLAEAQAGLQKVHVFLEPGDS